MRRLFVLTASGALLAVLGVVTLNLTGASAAGAASPTTSPSLMSIDLTQFGLDVNASSSIAGAQIDSPTAVGIATRATGASEPSEVIHATTAQVSPAGSARTVWVVLFLGAQGGVMPAGPAPDPNSTVPHRKVVYDYTGVVVDDQTGTVLYMFMSGHQE